MSVDQEATVTSSRMADYVELTKPKILVLVLVTVSLATVIGAGSNLVLWTWLHALIGTTLVASSASMLNQLFEVSTDARMPRTSKRPLPMGRLMRWEVLGLATLTVCIGMPYLWFNVGLAAAFWAFATWSLYAFVYTPAKTRTSWNTAIGAIPGALPVLIGWSAAGRTLDFTGAMVFAIMFCWQFPHFMAIAWLYRQHYQAADVKMLTVTDPTGKSAGRLAIGMAVATLLAAVAAGGTITSSIGLFGYVAVSMALGVYQLYLSIQFSKNLNEGAARSLLRFSLVYLPLQLASLTLASVIVI